LDISLFGKLQSLGSITNEYNFTEEEVKQFILAVKSMPTLKSIDIAGTNLHKIVSHKDGK